MSRLPEKALIEIANLAPPGHDAIAAILLQGLASEQRWANSFEKSQDLLAKLADAALAENQAGITKPF